MSDLLLDDDLLPEPSAALANADEASLIQAAQAGSAEAFEQLMHAYHRRLYAVAFHILGEAAPAADAAQEAMIAAFRHLPAFRHGSFKGWLYRIAMRKSYDILRDVRRRRSTSWEAYTEHAPTLASGEEGPESVAQRRELARQLEAGLSALPDRDRHLVVLSDLHDLSYREIAGATGTRLGTVRSRLSRARRKLRGELQAAGAVYH